MKRERKKRKRNETFLPLPFPEYLMIYEVGFVAKQQQKIHVSGIHLKEEKKCVRI